MRRALHFYFNANKRSVTLDVRHPDGQAIFEQLTKAANVVMETFPTAYL